MSQLNLSDLFQNSVFQYLYSNDSLCNFNITGKNVPCPSRDINMVELFCFYSTFLSSSSMLPMFLKEL